LSYYIAFDQNGEVINMSPELNCSKEEALEKCDMVIIKTTPSKTNLIKELKRLKYKPVKNISKRKES
jgi:hypothetical protein